MKKWQGALALMVMVLCLWGASAQGETAENISSQCAIVTRSKFKVSRLYDEKYTSKWQSTSAKSPTIEVTTPAEKPAYGLYICFAEMPEQWEIQIRKGEEWVPYWVGSTDYYHAYIELPGLNQFRFIVPSDRKRVVELNGFYVFGQGETPDWVQKWQPAPEKADLLVLVAHPDDELIFMGGTIPYYAVSEGKKVVVAYMTYSNTTRRSELLNGLWSMGVTHYPVIGTFRDTYFKTVDAAYKSWGATTARSFISELIRKYKPEVVVTHDDHGEYGHGAHIACAELALFCAENCGGEYFLPEQVAIYGTWAPQKLYLHLYDKGNVTTMNWRQPLACYGGKTALDVACEAFALHVSQQAAGFTVTDEGQHSNALFGLAYTQVGQDVACNDLFENVVSRQELSRLLEEEAVRIALEKEARGLRGDSLNPTPHPALQAPWPEGAGERNALGFLLEGEYVYENEEEGLWFYASPTLIVRIERVADTQEVLVWYEADVYVDLDNQAHLQAILNNPEDPYKEHVHADQIARENQVVFGLNTDYYTYRMGRNAITGIVVRGGEIFQERAPERNRSKFPNLDTLAMYADGTWGVYYADEYTAQEYVDMGAVDVFSFGPYLVRDGEMNPFVDEMYNGKTPQPRCALGIIETGHYYAVVVEGRLYRESMGMSLKQLQQHMYEKGCVHAQNMDGGQTALFTFMGKRITRIGKYTTNGKDYPRTTTEIIGIGRSAYVDPLGT